MTVADALLLTTAVIWGVNFAVVKYALASFSPLALNSVRFTVAVAVVTAAARLSGRRWHFERRHLPALIGLGILGNTGYQLLFIYGAAATTADNAALILATVPAWVALLGTVFGVERVRPLGWLGVALSLTGIAVIVTASDRAADFHFGGATMRGDVLILLCTLCWSLYTLSSRPLMRRYGVLTVTSFCVTVGAVPLILPGLPELLDREAIPAGAWAAAVASGALAIGIAYFCWNHGISHLGSARTALYSNLTPPIALVTAWLALGETLTAGQAGGAALAIAGVVLARRHASPLEP
ncbi:MAG: DMT family transporter [Thermoanaerobaculia bacterium]